MDAIPGLSQIIINTDNLAKLGAIGICIFFIFILIAFIIWLLKLQATASKQAWEARVAEAEADKLMGGALEKLRDELRELRYTIKCGGPNA